AGGGNRSAQAGERAVSHAIRRGGAERGGEARLRRGAHRRRQHQRHTECVRDGTVAVQRFGVTRIVGDEQYRGSLDSHLGQGLQQSRCKARIIGAQRTGGGSGLGRNAPVAGGGVVHAVMKAGGRQLPLGGSQHLADLVTVLTVAAGGGEHRRQSRRGRAGARGGF